MIEVRHITQVRTFKLILNRMTERTESGELAAVAFDRQSLIDWEHSQRGTWTDGRWHKTYAAGSVLEWFNPCRSFDPNENTFGHGIYDEWVDADFAKNLANNLPPHICLVDAHAIQQEL